MTQETDQKVVADVLSNPELMEVLQHPWVLQTLAHYAKKTFHSPDTRYGFWANNLRPEIKDKAPVIDNDGKPIYRHHGHENLREFDDTSKASGPHGEVDKN